MTQITSSPIPAGAQRLEVLVGLPASGKSTYADKRQDAEPMTVTLSRDSYRLMLKNRQVCSKPVEDLITEFMGEDIAACLRRGFSVIVDNTHVKERYATAYERFREEFPSVHIQYTYFETKVWEAIERDEKRGHAKRVGSDVINRMNESLRHFSATETFQQLLEGTYRPTEGVFAPIALNAGNPKAVTVDLDGTAALMCDRSPYDGSKCDQDLLNEPVAELVFMYHNMGYRILFLSGREDKWEPQTRTFLERHFSTIPYELFMRKSKDMRKDSVIKEELFRERIAPHYNAKVAIDDRLQVVKMWAKIGVFCLCVNQGLKPF
jgi:predicted kinase